ncbi:MAG: PDZ domain-containing protein [Planctomycetes bacterium]|nr:PDZ domain-containing protein [Planctomycetota bacterium]
MSRISNAYAWASLTCFAIALAAVGNAFAQEESQQSQSDQSQQQQGSDEQQKNEQNASQSETQSDQQSAQSQQDQDSEQQARQREQQQRQRQQQVRQRDRDEWPQPNRDQFGRDSLDFRSEPQWSDDSRRDYEVSRDAEPSAQSSRDQQAGLGVSIVSDGREGVVVSRVHSGSPAQGMGIRERDRITQVNGREVRSVEDFISQIRNMDPGQQVELDIRRAAAGEQTVRGELASRDEALADRGQRERLGPQQGRDSSQTSYEEERGGYSPSRSGQISASRLDQIERQVDRLSRELDELRFVLQDIRRQSGQPGQATQWDRERTASYDEYQRTPDSPRRTADRWQGENRFRQADRSRGVLRRSGDFDSGQRIERSRQIEGQGGQRSTQSDRGSEFNRDAEPSADDGQRSESQYRGNLEGDQSRDADETRGGEIGEVRQHVGPEDLNE